jgi:hypothetical protein
MFTNFIFSEVIINLENKNTFIIYTKIIFLSYKINKSNDNVEINITYERYNDCYSFCEYISIENLNKLISDISKHNNEIDLKQLNIIRR